MSRYIKWTRIPGAFSQRGPLYYELYEFTWDWIKMGYSNHFGKLNIVLSPLVLCKTLNDFAKRGILESILPKLHLTIFTISNYIDRFFIFTWSYLRFSIVKKLLVKGVNWQSSFHNHLLSNIYWDIHYLRTGKWSMPLNIKNNWYLRQRWLGNLPNVSKEPQDARKKTCL